MRLVLVAVIATCCARAQEPSIDAQALWNRARRIIRRNIELAPRYSCRQTIERKRYVFTGSISNCPILIRADLDRDFSLDQTDRARLDVSFLEHGEIFSWAGEKTFQSERVQDIVGGGLTSTGDFSGFLTSIFETDGAEFQYLGVITDRQQKLARYSYHVPRNTSHYHVQVGKRSTDEQTVAYQGVIWIHPESAELEHISIEVYEPPSETMSCRFETRIDYHRMEIGGASFLLPKSTTVIENGKDAARYINEIRYDACREFRSESVLLPASDPETAPPAPAATVVLQVLPPGLSLSIALLSAIDSETSFAGDALEGELTKPVKLNPGVLPKGTKVHGRLLKLARHFLPKDRFLVQLLWDSIETPKGPVILSMVPAEKALAAFLADHPNADHPNMDESEFRTSHLHLGNHFVRAWKTITEKPPVR